MRQWLWAGAALALAACGGNNGGGNATLDGNPGDNSGAGNASAGNATVGEAPGAGATVAMRPGQWEMTTQVTRVDIPNLPAGVRPPLPAPQTVNNCLTPEQAAQPNAGIWNQNMQGTGCTSEGNSMAGGRIQGRMQCDTPQGRATITTTGQYTGDTIDLTQQMETSSSGQTVTTEIHITGRRTGDCTG